ncbi:MAG TPA: molecular chaperone HtpG [Pyrinomonadaceae bacterium]|nr:molecular chaperone HtpG [Pyrinomonadaceae bacterium]
MSATTETLQFQAETKHLLDLMIHSLYTTKEIFLRELISNASDALDRLRFEALTHPELADAGGELRITLAADAGARTLTVADNGIGMSREELVTNIGTIARSGTRELREQMRAGASDEALMQSIGQFGVGFYSSFMVADKVTILTRRAGQTVASLWKSDGEGTYTVADASKEQHGTEITLHLKPADPESGIDDFTDEWVISRVVKRYSDYVGYPIVLKSRRAGGGRDEEESREPDAAEGSVEERVLNSMRPIWMRPPQEVSETDSGEFFRHLTHEEQEPSMTIFVKAEGLLEYRALLFVPSKAPSDLFYHASEPGLRLYSKGVLIMERSPDLLPQYLRFVKGIVDLEDLPLNISRQMPQQERQLTQIRKWLTKKILDHLQAAANNEEEKYLVFWKEFGRAFKEGVSSDYENRGRLVPLLLFQSSHDPERLTSLRDYVSRMKEGQQEIFYLTGESRRVVENSPHLEAFKEKGYEVLYLVDPVDELLVQALTEFEGRRLKSVGKGQVRLGEDAESEQARKELEEQSAAAAELLQFIQKEVDEYVKDVRLTNRLTHSPACLVGSELDYSPQLERLLQIGKGGRARQRRILELNPRHEIFARMSERFRADREDPRLRASAELLLGSALLAEGSELPDPVRFNQRLAELLSTSLGADPH